MSKQTGRTRFEQTTQYTTLEQVCREVDELEARAEKAEADCDRLQAAATEYLARAERAEASLRMIAAFFPDCHGPDECSDTYACLACIVKEQTRDL